MGFGHIIYVLVVCNAYNLGPTICRVRSLVAGMGTQFLGYNIIPLLLCHNRSSSLKVLGSNPILIRIFSVDWNDLALLLLFDYIYIHLYQGINCIYLLTILYILVYLNSNFEYGVTQFNIDIHPPSAHCQLMFLPTWKMYEIK